MGFGDALLAAAQAEELYRSNPAAGPVAICDRRGTPRWNQVWAENPAIWRALPGCAPPLKFLESGHKRLPYLTYPVTEQTGWRWSGWRARDHRPKMYFTPAEREIGDSLKSACGSFIVLEPPPSSKPVNRRPPKELWQPVVDLLRRHTGMPILQLGHAEAELLSGVEPITQANFREACCILRTARLLVTTEGGLVHAAAAMGVPAVVLFGGCVSAEALGYPEHRNMVDDDPLTPCGSVVNCPHCVEAWRKVTPELVVDAVRQELS